MEPTKKLSPLAEVERRVIKEGQQWMRDRMQEELQELADAEGGFSPLKRPTVGSDQGATDPTAHDDGDGGGGGSLR